MEIEKEYLKDLIDLIQFALDNHPDLGSISDDSVFAIKKMINNYDKVPN